MTTYHGIEQALCCKCGAVITDTFTLEVINDGPEGCPICFHGDKNFVWLLEDGTVVYTLDEDSLIRYEMPPKPEMATVELRVSDLEALYGVLVGLESFGEMDYDVVERLTRPIDRVIADAGGYRNSVVD